MRITITNAFSSRKISKHFRARELMCPCCRGCKIDAQLLEALEDIRSALGNAPIHINSGYRCERHNQEVNGSKKSQHMEGKAADIWAEGKTPEQVHDAACAILARCGGIIKHKTYVHVDVRADKYREDASNE